MTEFEDSDSKLSEIEKMALIKSLIDRKNISSDGLSAFEALYPNVPQSILKTANFHVYVDGIEAVFDWLMEAEQFLRNPATSIDSGKAFHLIYHLYNWLQFQEIIPKGEKGILDKIEDLKSAVKDEDSEAINDIALELEAMMKGDFSPPGFHSS